MVIELRCFNLFRELIAAYLLKQLTPRKYVVGTYYPSELPYCLRKQYFRFTIPKKVAPEQTTFFGVGLLFHHFIYDVLRASNQIKVLNIEKQYSLKHPDELLSLLCVPDAEIEVNQRKLVVEIKSTRSLGRIRQPLREHVLQVMVYLAVTEIENAVLLYLNKQTLETKEFPVSFESEDLILVLDRAKRLHKALKKKVLPPRCGPGQEWQCKECEYQTECDAYEAEVKVQTEFYSVKVI